MVPIPRATIRFHRSSRIVTASVHNFASQKTSAPFEKVWLFPSQFWPRSTASPPNYRPSVASTGRPARRLCRRCPRRSAWGFGRRSAKAGAPVLEKPPVTERTVAKPGNYIWFTIVYINMNINRYIMSLDILDILEIGGSFFVECYKGGTASCWGLGRQNTSKCGIPAPLSQAGMLHLGEPAAWASSCLEPAAEAGERRVFGCEDVQISGPNDGAQLRNFWEVVAWGFLYIWNELRMGG